VSPTLPPTAQSPADGDAERPQPTTQTPAGTAVAPPLAVSPAR
jgi:hypothetical protein